MDTRILHTIESPEDVRKLSLTELETLAQEVRERIIDVVAHTGGHLASSLGTVELVIALHYVFAAPRDKIVWDVGHQAYAHKILTGRNQTFDTLRQIDGLSGFLRPEESEYDVYGAGHASTAIGAALGLALGRDQRNEDYRVVAVAGDGSMTGGLSFEALNNAGHLNTNLLVILNDNEMSIGRNIGAVSRIFNRLITSNVYNIAKDDVEEFLTKFHTLGERLLNLTHRVEGNIKGLIVPGIFFEEMGIRYIGPVDGHDLNSLIATLTKLKDLHGPVVFHVFTQKGKGYKPAEDDPEHYHGSPKFDPANGETQESGVTYTHVFGHTLCDLAEQDDRIIAITAAMTAGTGLKEFVERFPDRFYDVGIAEPCAVLLGAGLAKSGFKPVVAVYSTFLQRAFDHILHDIALQKIPIVFVIDRAGLVGQDGPTHHGVFDLSYLTMIPDLVVAAPKDGQELADMLLTAIEYTKGPFAIRFPRSAIPSPIETNRESRTLPIGKAELLREGPDGAIFAIGHFVQTALEVADILTKRGVNLTVLNMRFAKPIDEKVVLDTAEKVPFLFSMEDNVLRGGFGSALNEIISQKSAHPAFVKTFGLPDCFIEHGERDQLYDRYGLSATKVADAIDDILHQKQEYISRPYRSHASRI